jgi:hypothetical protein
MRCAFVVRLGPESKPSEGRFEGWVEEVDTGNELRFRSNDELLKFLGDRFEAVSAMELDDSIDPVRRWRRGLGQVTDTSRQH